MFPTWCTRQSLPEMRRQKGLCDRASAPRPTSLRFSALCRINVTSLGHTHAGRTGRRCDPVCRAWRRGESDSGRRRTWNPRHRSMLALRWRHVPSRSPAVPFSAADPERDHLQAETCSTRSSRSNRRDHAIQPRWLPVCPAGWRALPGRPKVGPSSRRSNGICAPRFSIRTHGSGWSKMRCGRPVEAEPPRSAKFCVTCTTRTSGGLENGSLAATVPVRPAEKTRQNFAVLVKWQSSLPGRIAPVARRLCPTAIGKHPSPYRCARGPCGPYSARNAATSRATSSGGGMGRARCAAMMPAKTSCSLAPGPISFAACRAEISPAA